MSAFSSAAHESSTHQCGWRLAVGAEDKHDRRLRAEARPLMHLRQLRALAASSVTTTISHGRTLFAVGADSAAERIASSCSSETGSSVYDRTLARLRIASSIDPPSLSVLLIAPAI
jgi:hypothetical protein